MEKISISQLGDLMAVLHPVEEIQHRMPFALTFVGETFAVVLAPGDYETATKLVFETKFDIQRRS